MDYSLIEQGSSISESINVFENTLNRAYPEISKQLKSLNFWNNLIETGVSISANIMPSAIGGYYDSTKKAIVINSIALLRSSPEMILHILIHEGLHAGVISVPLEEDKVTTPQVEDEASTDSLTLLILEKFFGITKTSSGYAQLVHDLKKLLPENKTDPLITIYNRDFTGELDSSAAQDAVIKVIEILVVNPFYEQNKKNPLGIVNLMDFFSFRFNDLAKLFPRLFNMAFETNAGIHDSCRVSKQQFEERFSDDMFKLLAKKILEDDLLLHQILDTLIPQETRSPYTEEHLVSLLNAEGFTFLADFEKELLLLRLKKYINTKSGSFSTQQESQALTFLGYANSQKAA